MMSDKTRQKILKPAILLLSAICIVLLIVKLMQLHDIDRQYREITNNTGSLNKMDDMKAENPDLIGWITVYGTAIDLPVVQGQDNSKYLNTDVKGNESFAGCPFLDYRNSRDLSDRYSLIYGHHMENHMMFSDLSLFTKQSFWGEPRTGRITLADGQQFEISFFACITTVSDDSRLLDPVMARNNWNSDSWGELAETAQISHDKIGPEDYIVALSTCVAADSAERIVLLGKLYKIN